MSYEHHVEGGNLQVTVFVTKKNIIFLHFPNIHWPCCLSDSVPNAVISMPVFNWEVPDLNLSQEVGGLMKI
jgi:hypothetical protein